MEASRTKARRWAICPDVHINPEPSESSTFCSMFWDSFWVDTVLFRDIVVAPRVRQAVESLADISDLLRTYPKYIDVLEYAGNTLIWTLITRSTGPCASTLFVPRLVVGEVRALLGVTVSVL